MLGIEPSTEYHDTTGSEAKQAQNAGFPLQTYLSNGVEISFPFDVLFRREQTTKTKRGIFKSPTEREKRVETFRTHFKAQPQINIDVRSS